MTLTVGKSTTFPALTITQDEWPSIIDAARSVVPEMPLWNCVNMYGVCFRSILSALSIELWNLYCTLKGCKRVSSPAEYYDLPAIYLDAVNVIDTEIARIKQFREKAKANGNQ